MKRIILSILVLFYIGSVVAQSTDVSYKVTNYSINGENYDDVALMEDVSLVFYLDDDQAPSFANIWRASDSQSYGRVYALKKVNYEETDSTYAMNEIKFTWKFINSYDEKRGNAAVTIQNIYIGNSVLFNAEIIVMDNLEVLSLRGYLE